MIGLGTAATQLDTSVNIAFPAITRGFDLSIGDIQWVVICYVLTYASLLLALGRIGDTVGHALVFRIGLIWSTVALLLVGWSPSFGAMLLFRCLQGIGAALVLSCGAALVISLYGEERRSHALGIYTMMLSVGLMLGPLLGGALTAAWDWPAVFWFRSRSPSRRCSCCAACGHRRSAGGRSLRHPGRRCTGARPGHDAVGAQPPARIFRSLVRPAVRPRLCGIHLPRVTRCASDHRRRNSQGPGFALLNLVSVLVNLAAFSVWLLVPYFLARVPAYSLTESGAILATAAAGAALAAPIGGRLAGRVSPPNNWRSQAPRPMVSACCCSARGRSKPRQSSGSQRSLCRASARPVPACLFGYRDSSTSSQGSRRCRQPRVADANARHRDCCFGRPAGVRNPEHEIWLP